MTKNKNSIKTIIFAILMLAVVAVMLICYNLFQQKPVAGSKVITIEVVNKAQESDVYQVQTNAEYLRQVMEEAEGLTFSGADGMVDTINGERADYILDGAYWSFYINGEYSMYGIDTQPVQDGDAFQIIYTLAE